MLSEKLHSTFVNDCILQLKWIGLDKRVARKVFDEMPCQSFYFILLDNPKMTILVLSLFNIFLTCSHVLTQLLLFVSFSSSFRFWEFNWNNETSTAFSFLNFETVQKKAIQFSPRTALEH